jgi:FtsP/CotA-like multicopper oxidase with cupredoxin domain
LGSHQLTVTDADGLPVIPIEADAVLLGMGERVAVDFDASNPGDWVVHATTPTTRNQE